MTTNETNGTADAMKQRRENILDLLDALALAQLGEGVADDLLCAKVFHNSAVEPALAGGDIGNIADPCGVWLVKGEAARKEIGRDGVRVS